MEKKIIETVDETTGLVSSAKIIEVSEFRSIRDLKNYSDNEVNKEESMTDTTGYIPLSEDINRFLRINNIVSDDGSDDITYEDDGDNEYFDYSGSPDNMLDDLVENNQFNASVDFSSSSDNLDKSATTPHIDNDTGAKEENYPHEHASEQPTQKASEQA